MAQGMASAQSSADKVVEDMGPEGVEDMGPEGVEDMGPEGAGSQALHTRTHLPPRRAAAPKEPQAARHSSRTVGASQALIGSSCLRVGVEGGEGGMQDQ